MKSINVTLKASGANGASIVASGEKWYQMTQNQQTEAASKTSISKSHEVMKLMAK